jgi:glycosyltransferase involved in cell wall biosynthesis
VKLAIVTQRYGADINGGAELHARYVAEHLARHHEVEVLTTCARDYVTWANELAPGPTRVGGLAVHRFPVARPRRPDDFGRRSEHVFGRVHSIADELAWLASEGPTSPALIRHIASTRERYDFFVFFSFRYYHTWHGARAVPDRAVLVPTAERDPAVGLAIFGPIFGGVRAIMYNSPEERAMIQAARRRGGGAAGGDAAAGPRVDVPGVVVGVGSDVPSRVDPERFRATFGIEGPFIVYVGRIDENKGCRELFDHFRRHVSRRRSALSLVLVGSSILPVPPHARIRHLGFLDDRDKFDAIAAADALVMPSYFESLSMVVLESWALGRPVLVNGRCDVLRGQTVRSQAGLYYENAEEFSEALSVLETNRHLSHALGRRGREYVARHYAWPVIERTYLEILERLQDEDRHGRPRPVMDALPGFLARRRRNVPPAADVLATLHAGPVLPLRRVMDEPARRRPA